jgi:glyoxylase-like metal-dependent hydrolase (beta-lactamase superfamily II)
VFVTTDGRTDEHVAGERSGLHHPWRTAPAAGTTTAVAPGVRWLRMPLPFALDHINLWLLEDEGGWTAVDTGIGLEPTRARWERLFAGELAGRPLTRVVVTHFHPDHMGNAGWLAARFGVDLWSTDGEFSTAHRVWRDANGPVLETRLAHYRRHGFDDAAIDRFRQRGNHYPVVVPSLAASFERIADGDVLAIGGRRWQVFTVQGHAPEHACLFCPELGVLISGDQVLPKITTNVSVWPDAPHTNPLRLYLHSLARFHPLPDDVLVLPSHGLPFRGLRTRLERLRRHHDERLALTVGALAEPRTGVELIPVLFEREMDTHQLGFAIGEVLAHLHLLEADGAVARLTADDGIHRFRRA